MPVFLPRRWTRQPSYFQGIDWSNPVSLGLSAYQTGENTRPWTLSGPRPTVRGTTQGVSLNFASANNSRLDQNTLATINNAISVLAFVKLPSAQNAQRYVLQTFNTSSTQTTSLLYVAANTWSFDATNFNTFQNGVASSSVTINNEWQLVVGRQTSTTFRDIWINGTQRATDTATVPVAIDNFRIGRIAGGDGFTGDIALAAFWSRAISDAEIVALSQNPWQLFRPAANQTFYSLPSQGGVFSLSLDAGTYALTGRDVGTTSSRNIALDAGSYALTGRAVDFSFGRQLVLDAGSYNLTGRNVDLTSARSLGLDAGSYALTGRDVTLIFSAGTVSYTLSLDAGSYSLTGQNVGTSFGRSLALDAGSYALTGRDVNFNVTLNMLLDSGAYNLTGRIVGLTWSGETPVEITDRIITLRSLTERWRM